MLNSSGDFIALVPNALKIDAAMVHLVDEHIGGVNIFLGLTRGEKNAAGQALLALDYEAYAEMALHQLHDVAKRARAQWSIVKLVIWHRTGRVAVGEPSVLIAVASPHRAEAFAACRFIIDTLKAEAAIWKKEVWADGTHTWVGGG